MSEGGIVVATNISEWDEAVHALQANEELAAVWQITDEETALKSVRYDEPYDDTTNLYLPDLPPEFASALLVSYNASSCREALTRSNLGDYVTVDLINDRRFSGLHIDEYYEESIIPLNNHLVLVGTVEVSFVPLEESEVPKGHPPCKPRKDNLQLPERITKELKQHPKKSKHDDGDKLARQRFLLGDRYLGRDKLERLKGAQRLSTGGDLWAFSGSPNVLGGTLPVAHQFESIGATAKEREKRIGAFIQTRSLKY